VICGDDSRETLQNGFPLLSTHQTTTVDFFSLQSRRSMSVSSLSTKQLMELAESGKSLKAALSATTEERHSRRLDRLERLYREGVPGSVDGIIESVSFALDELEPDDVAPHAAARAPSRLAASSFVDLAVRCDSSNACTL